MKDSLAIFFVLYVPQLENYSVKATHKRNLNELLELQNIYFNESLLRCYPA